MTDAQKLWYIIEQSGLKVPAGGISGLMKTKYRLRGFLLDQEFIKAFFGNKGIGQRIEQDATGKVLRTIDIPFWYMAAQIAVLAPSLIGFYWEHVKDKTGKEQTHAQKK